MTDTLITTTPTTRPAGPTAGLSAGPITGLSAGLSGSAGGAGEVVRLRAEADRLQAEADRVRRVGDRLSVGLWVVAGLALVFTMANVTTFATSHGTPWWIGWLLDPMASLALLVVLVGDGVLSRHGVRSSGWARALKHGAAAGTWAMNTWASVASRDVAGVVLHSLPPALVIGLAEATPGYRARFAHLADQLHARADQLRAQADQLTAETTDRTYPRPQSPARTQSPVGVESPVGTESPVRVESPARTERTESTAGSARRSGRESARRSGRESGRRSEADLEAMVRAAIADGTLPPAPSGTAIHRVLGGGKGPALRVAERLQAERSGVVDVVEPSVEPSGAGDVQVIHLVEVAS